MVSPYCNDGKHKALDQMQDATYLWQMNLLRSCLFLFLLLQATAFSKEILVISPWLQGETGEGSATFQFQLERGLSKALATSLVHMPIGNTCLDEDCAIQYAKNKGIPQILTTQIQLLDGRLWITTHLIDTESQQRVKTAKWDSNKKSLSDIAAQAGEELALQISGESNGQSTSISSRKWLLGIFTVALISLPIIGYLGSQVETVTTERQIWIE